MNCIHLTRQSFYVSLTTQLRRQIIDWLKPVELADIFDEINPEDVDFNDLLSEMSPHYAAEMLAEMYTDNAVDLMSDLDTKQLVMYLSLMPKESAEEIKRLLKYEDDTTGSLMSTEFIAINQRLTLVKPW